MHSPIFLKFLCFSSIFSILLESQVVCGELSCTTDNVHFDQQMGALHAVPWLKSPFSVFLTFSLLFLPKRNKNGKKTLKCVFFFYGFFLSMVKTCDSLDVFFLFILLCSFSSFFPLVMVKEVKMLKKTISTSERGLKHLFVGRNKQRTDSLETYFNHASLLLNFSC